MANQNREKQPILQNNDSLSRIKFRYVILSVCCLGNTLVFANRMNWSIAIIAMVYPENHITGLNSTSYKLQETTKGTVFYWDMETQQAILGSFYYGYAVSPAVGGWLLRHFDGISVFMAGILMSSIAMIVSPPAASIGVGFLIFTRIIDGIGQGFTLSPMLVITDTWSEVDERGTFLSIASLGYSFGPILASYVSALLCSSRFLGGWPSTFYVYGICGVLLYLGWYIIECLSNIQSNNISTRSQKMYDVPWKKLIMSGPVIAVCIANFSFEFGHFLLFTDIPTFLSTILHFEIKTMGLLNILPQVFQVVTTVCGGFLADYLISHGKLSKIGTRHLLNVIGFGMSSISLVSLGYVSNNAAYSVLLIVIAFGMFGFKITGINANVSDFAPLHSGVISGIMFSIGACGGFIGTSILGALTETNNTLGQWKIQFWILAAVQMFGLLVFLILASGETQEWANPKEPSAVDTSTSQ
ncbi:vesicular glutamate transporter 1-like isoform X2 [Antedon mediterranea]|uniref:vesicular glutamate transporter 1-like isoform X2 n=1 Tax=Antedon mediterranea TaxID=105859 RepID=UPI003AF5CB9C